ncbi:hypothetical protein Ahy_A04g020632 isoform B [Arachis hypogaea]|uniref:Translocon-associated protein subunit beta n=1 Tax=Arachis hypogaea TaxID=3818 RepID=A0A445DI93_ARAHY|nr:hypothetical protein Ahy_A04g020632 isoform B [Arachis hypogaea]
MENAHDGITLAVAVGSGTATTPREGGATPLVTPPRKSGVKTARQQSWRWRSYTREWGRQRQHGKVTKTDGCGCTTSTRAVGKGDNGIPLRLNGVRENGRVWTAVSGDDAELWWWTEMKDVWGRYGGCNCGGAMAGRNLHGENSGGFSDFFTALPSIAAAHLAARRAARRSARRAARLCSFITAAHHLSNDEGTHRLTAVALIASLLVCSSLASSDVPLIVGHKKATLDRINSCAEMVSIAIDVYNQGTSYGEIQCELGLLLSTVAFFVQDRTNTRRKLPCFNGSGVSFTEMDYVCFVAFWFIIFCLANKFFALFSGGILSHTFELETNTKGVFAGEPAVIKFRVPTKAALQALSTPILPLDVLADRPPEQKFEWRLLAKYGSLISVISIIVLFVYLGATPSKSSTKGSKKRH